MTTVTKYTNTGAAGAEVHIRAERHAAETKCDYRDAVRIVLKADPELAAAYAQPATMTTKPAVPVPAPPGWPKARIQARSFTRGWWRSGNRTRALLTKWR